MTVWYHQSTILKCKIALRMAGLIAVCVAFITTLFLSSATYAAPGINQTLSFQGRLLTGTGGVVTDGYYNIQFKIYKGGTDSGGGTEQWYESYVNNNTNAGVSVKNGYFSVNLGSKNAFANLVDWNDDTLYLSMNIAGNSPSCSNFTSCSPDGEMTPMKRITSVPFAINSAQLGGRTADGFIQNSTSPQTANFNITGTGTAANLQASSLDTASAGTLTIGGANATGITMADDVTVAAGKSVQVNGILQAKTDSDTAFQVQNASGNDILSVNTNDANVRVSGNTGSNSASLLTIDQQGSGNASAEYKTTNGSWYTGVDNNDNSAFKINSSVASGTTAVGGINTVGANTDVDIRSVISFMKFTASATGTVSQVRVYVSSTGTSPNNKGVAGIYSNSTFGGGEPYQRLAASSEQTLVPNSWNTFTLSTPLSVANGTTYWLAYSANGASPADNNPVYETGAPAGTSGYVVRPYSSTLPATPTGGQPSNVYYSYYALIETDSESDQFSSSLFRLSNTGQAAFRNKNDSASAFQVQNALGVSALTVDTTSNSVLVAGALDTTTATTLNIGTANATAITMGSTSGNILTTLNGRALVKSTAGNNSTTAFQVQNASSTALLTADTTNMQVIIGSGGNTITLSANGITRTGTARNEKKITLTAEYTGAVLDAGNPGSNNGTMTSSVDLTSRMNYYKWTTSQSTNQNYDVVVQVPLPNDFDGWTANPLAVSTYTKDTTNGTITLEARDSTGTIRCNFVNVTPGSINAWATNNSACTLGTGTYTAGDYITLRLRMQSPNGGDVRIGNISLNYLSKY